MEDQTTIAADQRPAAARANDGPEMVGSAGRYHAKCLAIIRHKHGSCGTDGDEPTLLPNDVFEIFVGIDVDSGETATFVRGAKNLTAISDDNADPAR
jgi:hypothetical protein